MCAYVLLHGYAGSPAAWDEVRAALPSGSRVLCPALVGHAPDTGPASDFESEVERLARLIAAAGLAIHRRTCVLQAYHELCNEPYGKSRNQTTRLHLCCISSAEREIPSQRR